MKIGIIGAGSLGSNLARALANKGIPALISNSRGPASLAALVDRLGPSIRSATVEDAARCDIVVLAVRWQQLRGALGSLPHWDGRILVDATNPLDRIDPSALDAGDTTNPLAAYGIRLVDTGGRLSSEVVSELVPGARVVRAFNHFEVELLPEPEFAGGQRVLFYSGNDYAAKSEVRQLIQALGMFPVDLGPLGIGGALTAVPSGPLAMLHLVKV